MRIRPSLLVLVLLGCSAPVFAADPGEEKYRVVIMTDMTHDDGNSLIRYLYYTPFFDTEAIVVTPQLPDYGHDATAPLQKAMTLLDAYEKELPRLQRHDPQFPSADALRKVTKPGRGALPIIWLTANREFSGTIGDRQVTSKWGEIRFSDWVGEGRTPNGEPKDSEGSEFLQEVFMRDDDRPIFVQLWGGPITLVQALIRFRERQGEERTQKLLNKLHVYSIHLQEISVDYFLDIDRLREMPCAHLGEARSSHKGLRAQPRWFLFDFGHFWKYIKAMDPGKVHGHGPLSMLYDGGGEGDTPAFLYLVSAKLGLNDPLQPTQGSWGNQFFPLSSGFPDGYFHTCPGSHEQLMRWAPDATNSFLARLTWSVRNPSEVNHAPSAVLEGKSGSAILHRSVARDGEIELDASGSRDPDGDKLAYRWWVQDSPESPLVEIPGHGGANRLKFSVPREQRGPLHIVVEVRDDGTPSLVAYRRVVLSPSL